MSTITKLSSLTAALLIGTAGAAHAATVTVTTTQDSVPGSLRAVALAAADGDTVNLPAGRYVLSDGPITFSKDLTIDGAGARTTVIDAEGRNERIFQGTGFLGLYGVTLMGAQPSGGSGGAIDHTGDLNLEDDRLTGNGGANGGAVHEDGTARIVDSEFDTNSSISGAGALDIVDGSGSLITANTFAANTSGAGAGALAVLSTGGATSADVWNDAFSENRTFQSADGGALLVGTHATVQLANTWLAANKAGTSWDNCAIQSGGHLASLGHNLTDGGASDCGLIVNDHGFAMPQVGQLGDHGGDIDTFVPSAGSPLIGAGDENYEPMADARGLPAFAVSPPDIGPTSLTHPSVGAATLGSVSASSATFGATVRPVDLDGTVRIVLDDGTSSAGLRVASGFPALGISETVTGLHPQTTYHGHLELTTPDGQASDPDVTFTTAAAPATAALPPTSAPATAPARPVSKPATNSTPKLALVALRLTSGRRPKLTVRVNVRAGLRLTVRQRLRTLGAIRWTVPAGRHSLTLPMRVGRHRLTAGRYALVITATGLKARSVRFSVKR